MFDHNGNEPLPYEDRTGQHMHSGERAPFMDERGALSRDGALNRLYWETVGHGGRSVGSMRVGATLHCDVATPV